MSRLAGALGVLTILLVAMGFAVLNGGNRVTMDLAWITLYRVPVTFVAFGGLFFGMLVMLLAGLHTDLRVRTILRQRLVDEDQDEKGRVDTGQHDLFAAENATDAEAPIQVQAGALEPGNGSKQADELVRLPVAGTVGEGGAIVGPLSGAESDDTVTDRTSLGAKLEVGGGGVLDGEQSGPVRSDPSIERPEEQV